MLLGGGSSRKVDLLFLVIEIRHRMKLNRANTRLMDAPTMEDR